VGTVASPTWILAAEQDPSLNQQPVGTGPFEFESRVVGQETKFVRNDDYWREGFPYLDGITFRIVTDPQTRAAALKAGDLDMIHTTRAADIAAFRDDSDVKSYEDIEGEETFLLMNTAEAPFDDKRAREALALSTDRQAYVDLLGEGVTQVANGMFAPESRWFTDEVDFPEYDPAAGADLAADYCSDNPDNCNGDKIVFEYGTTPGAENQLVSDTLTSFWGDAFDVTVETREQSSFITGAATGDYQLNLWRQYGALDPDLEYSFLHSDSIDPGLAINFARLDDATVDQLLEEQRSEANFETRKEEWQELSEAINDYLPYIWLNHTVWAVVTQTGVQSVNDWELPEGQKGFPQYNGAHMLYQVWMAD
ncbi:MAG: ABC transporter substrate-binding protein, partial [Acidimicrobiia bacterium]